MQMNEITALELKQLIDAGEDVALIDVRESYEHEEFNIGGILIPLGEITSYADQIKELAENKIILYCRSGNRSAMAQKLLAFQHGITNTFNLKGGVIAWKSEVE